MATANSRAATSVTNAARDEIKAPHDDRRASVRVCVSVDVLPVAVVVGVAHWVVLPIDHYAVAAVDHDDAPWQPSCSWSDCQVRDSTVVSDNSDKQFADARESLATHLAVEATAKDPRVNRKRHSPSDVAAV